MDHCLLRDDIWWVGVVDWAERDFHGYELARGTTYNAYLILDQKTALVDGCRAGFGEEMLARVRARAAGRSIDYLVINHVEPDHSGSIPWLVEALSPAEVVCTKRAREALAKYYGADVVERWNVRVVGTGDQLSLGTKTLEFIEAPMLHWPDSMFTYVREAKTLLPNDAFGQHLATARRFADEVDMHVVMEEAGKYYANILMPFGGQIQRMLGKIKELGLEIEAIGPSHGVMWRRPEDVAMIVGAYDRWSSGQAQEQVVLLYDTMWHSTEKMTWAIAEGVAQEGVDFRVIRIGGTPRSEAAHAVLESRGVLVGSPTLNNGLFPTVAGFMTYLKGLRPKNKVAGAYGSCGWAGGAVQQLDNELRALGLEMLEPLEIRYRPTAEELESCVKLGQEAARRVKSWAKEG